MQMRISTTHGAYEVDLGCPVDLSLPLLSGLETVNCFWAPEVEYSPVVAGNFIGDTQQGGPVNFFNVRFNPHGNGTHTECVGHIALERYVLHQSLRDAHFLARLVSLYPIKQDNGDRVITREQIAAVLQAGEATALIIRTMPNDDFKKRNNYSGSNPPYLHHEAIKYMVACGIEHLLVDLPSVDREEDGGALLGHKAFWQYPENVRIGATITELIYVPQAVRDGDYLLNLQTAAFQLDASPSRPIIYPLRAI